MVNMQFTSHQVVQGTGYTPNTEATQRRRHHRLALTLGLATASIVAIAGTTIVLSPHKEYDERGCEVGVRPPHAITFLVDQSDAFSNDQLALVKGDVQRRAETVNTADLFSLFTLQRNGDIEPQTEIFRRCRPLRGSDVSFWIDHPGKREEEYLAKFAKPLKSALERAMAPNVADTSLLLEALYSIAQGPSFEGGGQGRTLMFYTDGLQNSNLVSFFNTGYSYEQLAEQHSVFLSGLRERFNGACVEMYVVSSKYRRQTHWSGFEKFWRDYWKAAGVGCLTFEYI